MFEIKKLRTRLNHVSKHVTQYSMTIAEARGLLLEIDRIIDTQLVSQPPPAVVAPVQYTIMDGGELT